MSEVDRRAALACLQAVEVNMAELWGIDAWRNRLSPSARDCWQGEMAVVRSYQHDLQRLGLASRLDQAVDADGG